MRWRGRRGSQNIEDRRSLSGPIKAGGGLLGIILVITVVLLGGDPRQLLEQMNTGPVDQSVGSAGVDFADDEAAQLVSVVLADTEEVWTRLFQDEGKSYREPTLVLFRGQVQSACGFQSAAAGPFYCPGDEKVYIDLSFFDQMARQLDAPGDFAQAYVIAHEIGHHVQKLLGINEAFENQRGRVGEVEANQLSVRLELQADFFAGVWAHHAQQNWRILEEGDVEEALNAASAIGDDNLQQQSRGYVVPESFTHGTAQQRVRWFTRGLKGGDLSEWDTFSVPIDGL